MFVIEFEFHLLHFCVSCITAWTHNTTLHSSDLTAETNWRWGRHWIFFKRLSADGCRQSTCTISAIDQSIVIDVLNTPDLNNILKIWEKHLELFLDHQWSVGCLSSIWAQSPENGPGASQKTGMDCFFVGVVVVFLATSSSLHSKVLRGFDVLKQSFLV